MSKSYSLRRAAYQAVRGYAEKGWQVGTSISRAKNSLGMADRDVAMATDIAEATIRHMSSLDAVLTAYCNRERHKVEKELWSLAQVGVAQLMLRPDVPAHASVGETVGVAKEVDKEGWTGFLNGLLRSIERGLTFTAEFSETDRAAFLSGPGEEDSPHAWCRFDRSVVDLLADRSEWASRAYGLPRWLVRRWLDREFEIPHERVMRACNRPPAMWLRVNPMRGSRGEIVAALGGAEPGELDESVKLPQAVPLASVPGFADGTCSVQDVTAMLAVDLLDPQEGESVLDFCAAPGGKTGHIAERMAGTGSVLACDVSEHRLSRVNSNVERLELTNVETRLIERDGSRDPAGPFDAALVDAPCSNTGVLAKRPEARWRVKPTDMEELPELQLQLVNRAAKTVRPGGRLVYSTCSIEPEENEAVVARFLRETGGWRLVEDELTLPATDRDGGYRALLFRGT